MTDQHQAGSQSVDQQPVGSISGTLAALTTQTRRRERPGELWWRHAACRGVDPNLFFPERGGQLDDARAICERCPVRAECADHAIVTGEKFGVWGGTSERQRRRIRRRLTLTAAP